MNLEFEWDNQKATLNLNKHGISFEVAKTSKLTGAYSLNFSHITQKAENNGCYDSLARVSNLFFKKVSTLSRQKPEK